MMISPLTQKGNCVVERIIDKDFIINSYNKIQVNVRDYFKSVSKVIMMKCPVTDYRYYYPFYLAGNEVFYEQLSKIDWYYMSWKWEHEFAMQYIKEKDIVLEIGCANGDFLAKLQEKKLAKVFGLEFNTSLLKKLKDKGIAHSNQPIQEIALQNKEKFDVVCSFQVLEHISEVKSFLESKIACLKPNGRLIISVPNNDSFIKYDKEDILNMPPHHMGLWNEKSLRSLASIFNLKILNLHKERLQSYHYNWYQNIMEKRFLGDGIFRKGYEKLKLNLILSFLIHKYAKHITGHTITAIFQK